MRTTWAAAGAHLIEVIVVSIEAIGQIPKLRKNVLNVSIDLLQLSELGRDDAY
jgi:hypothetical protein